MRNPCVLLLAALSLVVPTLGSATIQRTFVASNGVDTNACSIAAPCRSFGAAIGKTNAGGEVVVLDSAGYGPVTVAKPVSLIAPPGVYAGVTVFNGDGITIDAPGATVALRGLSINGQGGNLGIDVVQVATLHIENCVVSNMASNGIVLFAAGAKMAVFDTIVRDNAGTGIGVAADANVVLGRVRSEHNQSDGFFIAPSGGSASATVSDSLFAYNAANGISVAGVAGATALVQVERSNASNNGGAGIVAAGVLNGTVSVSIVRNGVSRNGGDGILIAGFGIHTAHISENTVHANGGYGIRTTSPSGSVSVDRNVANANMQFDIACNGQNLGSLVNNLADTIEEVNCSIVTFPAR
jgi:hypothetical protein